MAPTYLTWPVPKHLTFPSPRCDHLSFRFQNTLCPFPPPAFRPHGPFSLEWCRYLSRYFLSYPVCSQSLSRTHLSHQFLVENFSDAPAWVQSCYRLWHHIPLLPHLCQGPSFTIMCERDQHRNPAVEPRWVRPVSVL